MTEMVFLHESYLLSILTYNSGYYSSRLLNYRLHNYLNGRA